VVQGYRRQYHGSDPNALRAFRIVQAIRLSRCSPALWTTLDRIELAWPQEPHDLINALGGGINGKPKGNAIAQYENSCLSVCLDPLKRHALPTPFGESGNESCYVLAAGNRGRRCVHNIDISGRRSAKLIKGAKELFYPGACLRSTEIAPRSKLSSDKACDQCVSRTRN